LVYATYIAKNKIKTGKECQKENEKITNEAIEYYEEVIENIKDFQIEIKNQTILFLFIFKILAKNKDLKKK